MIKLYIISLLLLGGVLADLKIEYKQDGSAVASEDGLILGVGKYERTMNETGWSHLSVRNVAIDGRGCFGVGYLEGVLTADDIYFGFLNYIDD